MKTGTLAKLYANYSLYLFLVVVALSAVFLIMFALYPQVSKLISNQSASDALATKAKVLEAKAVALESYNEADLSKKVEVTLKVLPSEKDLGDILGQLQQITTQSGFSITSMSVSDSSSNPKNANSYAVKIQVKGSRALFPNLLSNLETTLRLMRISSADLSSNKAADSVDASLAVEVLYSKAPQSLGSIDSSLPQISQKDEDLLVSLTKQAEEDQSVAATQSAALSPRGKVDPFE